MDRTIQYCNILVLLQSTLQPGGVTGWPVWEGIGFFLYVILARFSTLRT